MSDRDDDFLNHGGDEFNPDADEFQIPDDPHSDDGFLTQDDEGFDLSEDDVLDMSGTDESDLFASESDEFDLGDEQHQDEYQEASESPGDYDLSDEDADSQEEASIGWKAWVGLALVAATAAGGLGYWAMPDTGGNSAASTETRQLPTPPPAPEPPMPAPKAGPTANAGVPTTQQTGTGSRRENGPIEISPFPEPSAIDDRVTTREDLSDIPEQMAGVEAPSQLDLPDEPLAPTNTGMPPSQTPPVTGSGGNNGGAGRIDLPPTISDDSFTSEQPTIQDPATRRVVDAEPEYAQALKEQRKAFSVLMNMTQQNGQQLANVRNDLNGYQRETRRDLKDLDKRVARLELRLEQDSKEQAVKHNETAPQADKVADIKTKPPKSPKEVKQLQETLKALNYRPGPVDGIFGKQTRWAIKRLQQEHGLDITGWLNPETLAALENPKRYSGSYDQDDTSSSKEPTIAVTRQEKAAQAFGEQWFVRGVTPIKAILYRPDGMSFVVKVGSEIPGMGQVTALDPEKLHVITPNGVITRR